MRSSIRPTITLASAMLIVTLVGCGESTNKVQRVSVEGQIVHDGKPLSEGVVRFFPNNKKGNSGPVTSAGLIQEIDGKPMFRIPRDRGAAPGPARVLVVVRGENYSDDREKLRGMKHIEPRDTTGQLIGRWEFFVDVTPENNSDQPMSFTFQLDKKHKISNQP